MTDVRIDAIVLTVGQRSLRLTHPQLKTLELLAYLSKTLRLRKWSESSCEYAPGWMRVEIDGDRFVEVDYDGRTDLLPVGDES